MKFAHLADVHLGAWRDPKMRKLGLEAFTKAVDVCLKEKVDFVLIAGDFFNTSLPGIDVVQFSVRELKRLKCPVYIIPGSHDFSSSGKTMLNVLEEAEIITNVWKGEIKDDKLKLNFTEDPKTGVKMTGILGRRGSLENSYYEELDLKSLEKETGTKIFLFHSAIEELKPSKFEKIMATPLSLLPKGFDYYAGGHVHIVEHNTSHKDYKHIVYPGPIFPASFSELEELECGGFFIYDDGKVTRKQIRVKTIFTLKLDADKKSAEKVSVELRDAIKGQEFLDTIVLIRVSGKLKSGKMSDIKFKDLFEELYGKGAYFVMKNTAKLTTEEFEAIRVETGTPEEIEERVIKEHKGQVKVSFSDNEAQIAKSLMKALGREQDESEKKYEYEERVKSEAAKVLDNI